MTFKKVRYTLCQIILPMALLLMAVSRASSAPQETGSMDEVYSYNQSQVEFLDIPPTKAGVDSLLRLADENLGFEPEKAAKAILQALDLSEILEYNAGLARSYDALGSVYHRLNDYEYALEQFNRALELEAEINDPLRIGQVLNHMGDLHLDYQEYEMAAAHYQRTADMMSEIGNTELLSITLTKLGLARYHLDKYEESLEYFQRAIEVTGDDAAQEKNRMIAYKYAGKTYRMIGDFEDAEYYLQESNKWFREHDEPVLESQSHQDLGQLYLEWGRHERAEDHARRGLHLAQSTRQLPLVQDAFKLLSNIYEADNQPETALAYYRESFSIHNILMNTEQQQRIAQRQIRFDLDHRNRQITRLNEENALQEARLHNEELWRWFMLTGIILFVVIIGLQARHIFYVKRFQRNQQQQKEEIERQNLELVQLNQEKDDFLKMAAHDLRNPLAIIQSIVSLMGKGGGNKNTRDEDREYFELIKKSTDNMMGLINNFLNIHSVKSRMKSHELAILDIREPLQQVIGHFERRATEKKIQLKVEIEPGIKPALADPDYFHRIMENLLSNAIKYSPYGSQVEIRAGMESNELKIDVRDYGPGISEEDQKHLFKPYSRLTNKPTGNESSTGLGLFTAKKLTELMGGRIRSESRPGFGSTFTLWLPVPDSDGKDDTERLLVANPEIQG